MKNFDLAAAKAGAPVCTEGGRNARIICTNRAHDCYTVVALVDVGGYDDIRSYTSDGEYNIYNHTCLENLMMRDDDYAEKLARGEYGNHIVDVNKKVSPTCKESLPVENSVIKENLTTAREYWRYKFAGQAMPVLINAVVREGKHIVKGGMCILDAVATDSVKYADGLIAELEKTEK